MDAEFPDAATVHTAVELAVRAPSVHNSQPWRWRADPRDRARVHLLADPARRLQRVDPAGRDLLISCGAALHHAVVAFTALGWHATVRRLPDPADPTHLAVLELRRDRAEAATVGLAAAIPRRRTDRRLYSSWPVADGDIALMAARVARGGVMLRRLAAMDTLRPLIAAAVRHHVADAAYLAELTAWSGRYGSTAGVPASNTPRPEPAAGVPARVFAGPALAQPPGAEPADDHSVLLALGTAADDATAWLRAGEATSVVLLTATALGLASCPVTEPLEVAQTRAAVGTDVFGDAGYPQMLVRVGWAPVNADPLPATPRRALAEVWQPADSATRSPAAPTTAARSRRPAGCPR